MVRCTFSPARAWRPAVVARLARTLGITGTVIALERPDSQCGGSHLLSYCGLAPSGRQAAKTHLLLKKGFRVKSLLNSARVLAKNAVAEDGTKYGDAIRALHVWLDAQRDYDRLIGISAGVVHGDRLLWSAGYGSLDAPGKVPTKADTIYSIGSISKLFTSIAVMQLVEAGKLRLDDELTSAAPHLTLPRAAPGGGPITLRNMLTHSSGLPAEGGLPGFEAPDFRFPTQAELRLQFAQVTSLQRSGERYRYSNFAMSLLAEVIEAASGQRYEEYVHQHVLVPLGLKDTQPRLPIELLGQRLALGYGPILRDGTRALHKPFDTRGYAAAAGFSSTVPDLARFASWQFRLLKGGGREVLRADTLQEMQRVHWTDPDGRITAGLGFSVSFSGSTRLVGHTGNTPGYFSVLTMQPQDELAVIVLTNNEVSVDEYARSMCMLLDKGRSLPTPEVSGSVLSAYSGLYSRRNRGGEEAILPWGRELALIPLPSRDPAGEMLLLAHTKDDIFQLIRPDGSHGEEVSFLRDGTGKVTGYKHAAHVSPRMRELPSSPADLRPFGTSDA